MMKESHRIAINPQTIKCISAMQSYVSFYVYFHIFPPDVTQE